MYRNVTLLVLAALLLAAAPALADPEPHLLWSFCEERSGTFSTGPEGDDGTNVPTCTVVADDHPIQQTSNSASSYILYEVTSRTYFLDRGLIALLSESYRIIECIDSSGTSLPVDDPACALDPINKPRN